MLPKITVVTVVYNGILTLDATIKSVISQTYSNLEYIVVDGGSTDGTLELLKKYNSQISIIISEKDDGLYDAMNKGIALSTGEWICFMNCGDIFSSCNVLTFIFENNDWTKADIIYGLSEKLSNMAVRSPPFGGRESGAQSDRFRRKGQGIPIRRRIGIRNGGHARHYRLRHEYDERLYRHARDTRARGVYQRAGRGSRKAGRRDFLRHAEKVGRVRQSGGGSLGEKRH